MPLASETSRVQYSGNNSTVVPYGVPFYFLSNADIRVVATGSDAGELLLLENTHYTLTGAGNPSGGTITTLVPYDNLHSMTIYREPQLTQSANFQSTGALPADTLTRGLDKLTMLVQSLSRKVARCFRLNDKAGDVEALSEAGRANTVFGFDSGGAPALRDGAALRALVELPGAVQHAPTAYWMNDGEKALKVPDFTGQMGIQLNTSALYRATGTAAGNWAPVSMAGMTGQLSLGNIPDALVTYAKLQPLAASHRILGRNGAGSGVAEEVTLSQLLDWIGTAAQGDILYRGATAWQRLPAGAAGLPLITKGAGQNPAWEPAYAPGTVVKADFISDTGHYSSSTSLNVANIATGTQFFTTTYTPRLATSTIHLRISGYCSGTTPIILTYAAFVNGGTVAIAAGNITVPSASYGCSLNFSLKYANTSSAAKTFSFRFGTNAGTAYINTLTGTDMYGALDEVNLQILEVAP